MVFSASRLFVAKSESDELLGILDTNSKETHWPL